MYRHFIAPERGFTRLSHELIRHPRLSSDAVRLLTWQLSLPDGARESLSRTAERARIGACAFMRAKRQLKEEGFVHELRTQGPGGRWVTRQLVSNQPLGEAEAAKLLGKMPVPTAGVPAVGGPAGRRADGHPKKDRLEETSNRPPEPDAEAGPEPTARPEPEADAPAPEPEAVSEEARALVGALPLLSPALRHIPPGMTNELARLAADWLAAGHSAADVHRQVLRGLPGDGTVVHKPGGLVRYLLREVRPVAAPEAAPVAAPAAPSATPAKRRLSARLTGTRECESERHVQPMLFRPVGDETLCPRCASASAS